MSGVAHNPEDSPDLPSSNGPSEDTSSSLGWAGIQAHLDTYDEGKKKGAVEDIDTLLVFAGLFSAILTAFVVQTYPMLQPNSSDTTNQLLIMNNQLLLYGLTAPIPLPHGRIPPSLNASAALATQSSTAPASARSINILFFFSLVLSLAAALFGISAKQWLREFMLWNSPLAKPRENIIVRQMRFEDWEAWNVDATIAAIPALLEIAMILFLIGMIILLWTLDDIVAIALSTIVAAFLLAVSAFTVLPVLFLRCPYRSPTAMVCLRLLNLVRVPIPYGAQLLREAARVYAARWARAAKHRREAHPDWMTGYPHDDVENSSRQASPHFAISSTPPGGRNDSPAEIPPETLPANSDSPLSSRPSSQLDTQRPSPLLPIRLRPRRIPRLCIRIAFVVQCSWDIVYHPCDTPANTDRESPSTGQDDVGSPSFHRIPWPRYPQNWRNLDLDSRSATRVTTGRWWAPWRHVLCHAMEALDYETATSVHDALLGRNIISQASEHDAMALLVDISEIAYLVRALTWVSNSSNAPAIQDYIDMAVMTAHSDGHSCLPLGTKMVTMWTMISAGERNSPLHLLRSLFDAHNILTLREASGTYVEQFGRRIVSISSDEPVGDLSNAAQLLRRPHALPIPLDSPSIRIIARIVAANVSAREHSTPHIVSQTYGANFDRWRRMSEILPLLISTACGSELYINAYTGLLQGRHFLPGDAFLEVFVCACKYGKVGYAPDGRTLAATPGVMKHADYQSLLLGCESTVQAAPWGTLRSLVYAAVAWLKGYSSLSSGDSAVPVTAVLERMADVAEVLLSRAVRVTSICAEATDHEWIAWLWRQFVDASLETGPYDSLLRRLLHAFEGSARQGLLVGDQEYASWYLHRSLQRLHRASTTEPCAAPKCLWAGHECGAGIALSYAACPLLRSNHITAQQRIMKLLKSRPPAYSADEAELPDYELERFLDGRWASRAPTVSDAGTHREVMASVEQQDWYAMHVRIGDMLHDPRQNSGTMLPDPESMNAAPEQNRSGTADAGSHVSAEQA